MLVCRIDIRVCILVVRGDRERLLRPVHINLDSSPTPPKSTSSYSPLLPGVLEQKALSLELNLRIRSIW
jgi:hypothetical protein